MSQNDSLIECKVKLPEHNKEVYLRHKNYPRKLFVGSYNIFGNNWQISKEIGFVSFSEITHWKPFLVEKKDESA